MLVLEFTIEPFVEGNPGPHVLSAVAAAEALGLTVEFGPFGSTCEVATGRVGEASSAIIAAAFANGATHVTLHAERVDARDTDAVGGDLGTGTGTEPAAETEPATGTETDEWNGQA